MSEFHFSPRTNRAHEIAWQPWSGAAFERARREDKPILLSISAVWCHWCHVMDETSYSDGDVIARINEQFVPVRVDNDLRPDVNARYNMGGWPTTAFLTPDGTIVTGATYLPPDTMRRVLDDIARFYAENKAEIAARSTGAAAPRVYDPAAPAELTAHAIAHIVEEIAQGYDDLYGGFGDAPKFPQTEALEFLLSEWRISGEQRLFEMVAKTMLGMSRGGMYDHVEGGFFRYSTTRDWSVPHFEKMSEDHAGLIRLLSSLVTSTRNHAFRDALISTLHYARTVLRDPKTGFFAGSQDADEAYYERPLDERRKTTAPYVDRRAYSNWTAGLASAWAHAARALDDDTIAAETVATLDAMHERLRDPDGLLFHVLAPGEAPAVRGLLTDQVSYSRALIDAHELTGEARFLERACAHADATIAHLGAPDGGFFDHAPVEEQIGRLTVQDRPIIDNGVFADALLRLATLTDRAIYREHAQRTLLLYARTHANAGSFAATYARALRRFLAPSVSVKISGAPPDTGEFREAASRLPSPLVCVRTEPSTDSPAAQVCVGMTCAPPARDPALIRDRYDSLVLMTRH